MAHADCIACILPLCRYEVKQYADAIDAYQNAEYSSIRSINLLNVVQSAIMFCGIASGLLVCASKLCGIGSRTGWDGWVVPQYAMR